MMLRANLLQVVTFKIITQKRKKQTKNNKHYMLNAKTIYYKIGTDKTVLSNEVSFFEQGNNTLLDNKTKRFLTILAMAKYAISLDNKLKDTYPLAILETFTRDRNRYYVGGFVPHTVGRDNGIIPKVMKDKLLPIPDNVNNLFVLTEKEANEVPDFPENRRFYEIHPAMDKRVIVHGFYSKNMYSRNLDTRQSFAESIVFWKDRKIVDVSKAAKKMGIYDLYHNAAIEAQYFINGGVVVDKIK